jgi:hypothetical protein
LSTAILQKRILRIQRRIQAPARWSHAAPPKWARQAQP